MNAIIYRNNSSSAASYPPDSPTNLAATGGKQSITLTWTDPADLQLSGGITINWKYTRIVRKASGYPENENDGIVVVENSTRNQYQSNGYVDSGLGYEETWYYAAFACSEDGAFSKEICQAVATTKPAYKTMTVTINLNDSNPSTCGTYSDDAISMESGKTTAAISAWQNFFGYKPCLFKNGEVVGYLNPNNYAQFEDGSTADITSGNSGDVMVEFPRRGINITNTGSSIVISMTDNPDDPDFTYYAHTMDGVIKDNMYVSCYCSYNTVQYSNSVHSLSGITPKNDTSYYRTVREAVQNAYNRGQGYTLMTYYQLVYIQVMYLLQFKGNTDSQKCIGNGITSVNKTGSCNTQGLFYGSTSNYTNDVKIFGIETLYGGYNSTYIHNIVVSNRKMYLTTNTIAASNIDKSNAYEIGPSESTVAAMDSPGYITKVFGTNEFGFYPLRASNGSATTYFCDYCSYYSTALANQFILNNPNGSKMTGLFAIAYGDISGTPTNYRLAYI